MHGIHTNVALLMGDNDSDNDNDNDSNSVELGVTLTFQGATKNGTHACLATMDYHQDQKLCIDFVSNRCDSAWQNDKKKPASITEETIFRSDDDYNRRALFEQAIQKDSRHRPVSAQSIRGNGRRMGEEDEYVCTSYGGLGCFYAEFISIVFIGA